MENGKQSGPVKAEENVKLALLMADSSITRGFLKRCPDTPFKIVDVRNDPVMKGVASLSKMGGKAVRRKQWKIESRSF